MKGNMSQSQRRADHNTLINRNAENQHSIGAIEGLQEKLDETQENFDNLQNALDTKVPTERKVNGQTLDNDVEIKNVESADKLKTARTINGVEFDGSKSIKIYGENELPLNMKTINTAGWYRVAQIYSGGTSAVIHISRNYANSYPETYTIIMDAIYENCDFTQISALRIPTNQLIQKIRVVYKSGMNYLEFYYSQNMANTISVKLSNIMKTHTTDTFSNVDFEEGSIPEGFNVKEFALSGSPIKASSLEIGTTKLNETQLQALLALLT